MVGLGDWFCCLVCFNIVYGFLGLVVCGWFDGVWSLVGVSLGC